MVKDVKVGSLLLLQNFTTLDPKMCCAICRLLRFLKNVEYIHACTNLDHNRLLDKADDSLGVTTRNNHLRLCELGETSWHATLDYTCRSERPNTTLRFLTKLT